MWMSFERWSYVIAIPTLWLGLYVSLDFVLQKTSESAVEALAVIAVIALWANAYTAMIYYRRRLKMLQPEEM